MGVAKYHWEARLSEVRFFSDSLPTPIICHTCALAHLGRTVNVCIISSLEDKTI